MNKQLIRKELKAIGIKVKSFEFTEEGHRMQLELINHADPSDPWEKLDCMGLEGFELVSPRFLEPYEQRITLIPNCESEFIYYINKYVSNYGLSRSTAIIELTRIVENAYNPIASSALDKYKQKFSNALCKK